MITRLLGAASLALLAACAVRPQAHAMSAVGITSAPPGAITFDEVAAIRPRPRVLAGPHGSVHDARCSCMKITGCAMTCPGARSPCVVRSREVFKHIAAYREILARGLDADDIDYWFLLTRANDSFHAAVRAVLGRWTIYDVVFEAGEIELREGVSGRDIPDITAAVIEALT